MMQFTAQSCNALFHTIHLSIFVSCLITAFSFVFSLCDTIFIWPNGPTCFCSVHPMDHSRNQNNFATIVSSALLCDRQLRNSSWWASIGTKGKRKTWWWFLPLLGTHISSAVPWLPGSQVSPRKALLCIPFTQQKGQLTLPGLANLSFAGNSKTKASSVPVPVVLGVFLWYILLLLKFYCLNPAASVQSHLEKKELPALGAVEESLGKWTLNALAFRPIKTAWHRLSCK